MSVQRIALKQRGAAAAIKIDPFPFKRPPRHGSQYGADDRQHRAFSAPDLWRISW
jgi:hypothetical protein